MSGYGVNGSMTAFQAVGTGSNPVARSMIKRKYYSVVQFMLPWGLQEKSIVCNY